VLLIDLSNLMYSAILGGGRAPRKGEQFDPGLVRHITLKSLVTINKKFAGKFGPPVLAVDSTVGYWRRDVFPLYKHGRKKTRDASDLNWPEIYSAIDEMKRDLQTTFPYKYLCVDRCEADDVIGVLVNQTKEDTLIIAGDKDYLQLHRRSNIWQYDRIHKKYLHTKDPDQVLMDHIVHGDRGDGVPNIASADNVFAIGARQKKITAAIVDQLETIRVDDKHPLHNNWVRNQRLIDLSFVPNDLQTAAIDQFYNAPIRDRSQLFKYFAKHKLKSMMENINDF
jgi:hypothetical protein